MFGVCMHVCVRVLRDRPTKTGKQVGLDEGLSDSRVNAITTKP